MVGQLHDPNVNSASAHGLISKCRLSPKAPDSLSHSDGLAPQARTSTIVASRNIATDA